jgi:hypothetical protein
VLDGSKIDVSNACSSGSSSNRDGGAASKTTSACPPGLSSGSGTDLGCGSAYSVPPSRTDLGCGSASSDPASARSNNGQITQVRTALRTCVFVWLGG